MNSQRHSLLRIGYKSRQKATVVVFPAVAGNEAKYFFLEDLKRYSLPQIPSPNVLSYFPGRYRALASFAAPLS